LNEVNKRFFNFINTFFQGIYANPKDGRVKNTYNNEEMNLFVEDLKSFVGAHSFDESKVLSFFTFDQQLKNILYRPTDQNFEKNYEFVFSGCSQTNGYYITEPSVKSADYKDIWGFQIADAYGKEALNLGMGGWGAEAILKGLMHHFEKNGNPKILLVLYPDLGRIEGVDNYKVSMKTPLNHHEMIQHWFLRVSDDEKVNKVSTLPHAPSDVIPFTQALYRNLQSILILDQYCRKNNIYFKYTSWDNETNAFLKMLKGTFHQYSNYSDPVNPVFDKATFKNLDCHKEIEKDKLENIWNIGSDNQHIGIHQHIHIAEQFKKEIDNDNPWN